MRDLLYRLNITERNLSILDKSLSVLHELNAGDTWENTEYHNDPLAPWNLQKSFIKEYLSGMGLADWLVEAFWNMWAATQEDSAYILDYLISEKVHKS